MALPRRRKRVAHPLHHPYRGVRPGGSRRITLYLLMRADHMKSKYLMIAALLSLFALAGCKRPETAPTETPPAAEDSMQQQRSRPLRRLKCRRPEQTPRAINPTTAPSAITAFEVAKRAGELRDLRH